MRQIFFIVVLFFVGTINIVFADSDPYNNYTLIDCIDGSDETWTAFDSSFPYQSLKAWIEKSINYINTNVNVSWNTETASWKTFTIKVNCTTNDLLSSQISLGFNWKAYNNELLIEWVGNNGLIIQDMYFYLPNNTGQIIFKNAKFLDNSKYGYYFKLEWDNKLYSNWVDFYNKNKYDLYNFYWIKIIDSYIKLSSLTNFSNANTYQINVPNCNYVYCMGSTTYSFAYYLSYLLQNSIIEIDIIWNYSYKIPFLLKDSKLSFINTWTWIYDINFVNQLNSWNKNNYWNTILMSNEIDLWWNNFKTENKTNIAFINNKFSNFSNFNFSWNALFFNNTIENQNEINISNSKNLINNVFSWGFTDTYDKNNLRRNYSLDNISTKWIWWFFRIKSPLKYFNTEVSTYSLYKEITGQDLPQNKDGVYVIYNN